MERENYMEQNPYDILIEPAQEPVSSPVIFAAAQHTEPKINHEETMEMEPLSEQVQCSKIRTKEYASGNLHNFEVEADLLVPDTEPDMDMILNVSGQINGLRLAEKEGGICSAAGAVDLEIVYRSRDNYGDPVRVISSALEFTRPLENVTSPAAEVNLYGRITKTDCRILNERKYKVKIFVQLETRILKDCERSIFEGIKDQPLYFKKEKINFPDVSEPKKYGIDIDRELLINDEKVRPVKIMKAEFSVCENHRQLTKDKLILGETIWVRILYMAEVASMGNLHNQPMFYQACIDETQFIPLPKMSGGASASSAAAASGVHLSADQLTAASGVHLSADQLTAEINAPCSGFTISGAVYAEPDFITFTEKEVVTDFFHAREDLVCDLSAEELCTGITQATLNHTITDSVAVENDNGMRIIYTGGNILECALDLSESVLTLQGKVQVEAVTINQGDYTTLAKKICSFSCSTEIDCAAGLHAGFGAAGVAVGGAVMSGGLDGAAGDGPGGAGGDAVVLEFASIKEITASINGNQIDFNVSLVFNANIHHKSILTSVSNPCIVRSSTPETNYPITVHTVKDYESSWEIAKSYKVDPDSLTLINGPDCIRPGNKIVIVK